MIRAVLRLFQLSVLAMVLPSQAAEFTITLDAVAVEDGDTLLVQLDGAEERIQLAGIDAPEDTDNPKLQKDIERTGLDRDALIAMGQASTQHLRDLVNRGGPFVFTYDPEKRDRYGRITAEVSAADNGAGSLNIAMIEDGYAIVMPVPNQPAGDDSPAVGRAGLQREAIATRRGLWGDHRENALAWRGKDAQ